MDGARELLAAPAKRIHGQKGRGERIVSIISGIGWHMVGAASAASFYAPIEKVKKWSWETTWAVAGVFSWILLPIWVSFLLLPSFVAFYASIRPRCCGRSRCSAPCGAWAT